MMRKIQFFQSFIKPEEFTRLMAQAMREIGPKNKKTPNLMREFAEYNSRKGDLDKALHYINRAVKIAEEVLDGVKVHKKYISLLRTKTDLLLKKKQWALAVAESEALLKMVEEIVGGKDNDWYASLALWRGMIFQEIKDE
jgi:tetratricopeptide (TPR) repeat protein